MSDIAGTRAPLGVGSAELFVPEGWEAFEVGGGAFLEVDDEADLDVPPTPDLAELPPVAAGIAETTADEFSANVLFLLGHDGVEAAASELGEGQIWHDSRGSGAVLRRVVRFGDHLGTAIVTTFAWMAIDDAAFTAIATVPADRLEELWPTVAAVLRSVVDDPGPAGWEGWL